MKLFYSSLIASLTFAANVYADTNPLKTAGFANNSDYYLILSGTSAQGANCKETCYSVLGPKKSDEPGHMAQQWVDIYDKKGWIYVGYNVCEDVTYSNAGLAQCDNYLGHLGVTFSTGKTVFEPQSGSVTISANGSLEIVAFVPDYPPEPIVVPNPVQYETVPFRGNNIAAAEFSSPNIDWIIQDGFPNEEELAYFAEYGMNTYRIPIRWSYAQPALEGPLNQDYVEQLVKSSELYLKHGFNVIIDLHSYMRFQADSTIEPSHAGQVVNAQELTDIWDKLSDALLPLAKQYPTQLMLDLMNEPMKDLNSIEVLDRYNAVIHMLREKEINNLILLEGAHWSGMHSWLFEKDRKGQSNADVFVPHNIKDSANNYAINVHQYFDADNSGTNVQCTNLPENKIKDFINWAQKHELRFMVTEFGGADAGNCHGMIQEFLTLIHDSEQLLGWTLWAGGRHWGEYMLSNYKNGGAIELPNALVEGNFLQHPITQTP